MAAASPFVQMSTFADLTNDEVLHLSKLGIPQAVRQPDQYAARVV